MSETVVITDTSALINFPFLDLTKLLAGLSTHRFIVTDRVHAEITAHDREQIRRLEKSFADQILQ